jgi:hypothetical protein
VGKFAFFVGSAMLVVQFALDLLLQVFGAKEERIPGRTGAGD